MTSDREKVVQYLNEAHAGERDLVRVLQAQIAIAPRGRHREGLESHLGETRSHADRIERRLQELGHGRGVLGSGVGMLQGVLAEAVAGARMPLRRLRGTGGSEKVLKNAKDACASEALEIATYTAVEDLARSAGDVETARLAVSIRSDEQDMFEWLIGELPALTEAVVASEVRGESTYQVTKTEAADAARAKGRDARRTARTKGSGARRTARKTRKAPRVAPAQREIKGAITGVIEEHEKGIGTGSASPEIEGPGFGRVLETKLGPQ